MISTKEQEEQKIELVCSEAAHVFDHWSEICKCGTMPRHRVVTCSECGNQYWTKRATNPTETKGNQDG